MGPTHAQLPTEWGGALSPLGAATLPRPRFPETGQVTFRTTLVSDRLIIPLLTELLFFSCSIKRGSHRDGEVPPLKHRRTPRVPQHLVPAHLSSRGWETVQIFYLWLLSKNTYLVIHVESVPNPFRTAGNYKWTYLAGHFQFSIIARK